MYIVFYLQIKKFGITRHYYKKQRKWFGVTP